MRTPIRHYWIFGKKSFILLILIEGPNMAAVSMYVPVVIINSYHKEAAQPECLALHFELQISSITIVEEFRLNEDFLDEPHGADAGKFSNQLKLFNK
jgi:hypothetical protein